MNERPSLLGAFLSSIIYTCKPGNIAYITLIGTTIGLSVVWGLIHTSYYGVLLRPQLLTFVAIPLFLSKITDNSARICRGMKQDPVPLSPFATVDSKSLAKKLFFILLLFYLLPIFVRIPLPIFAIFFFGIPLIAHFVLPALICNLVHYGAFEASRLRETIADIGTGRYIAMTIIGLLLTSSAFLFIALNIDESAGISETHGYYHGNPSYPFFIGSALLLTVIAAINGHFFAFLYPPVPEDDDDGIIDADSILHLTDLGMTGGKPLPAASSHQTPPADLTLLQDADTSGMDMDTQQAFARALAEADAHIRSGAPDKAIPILGAWTTARHSIAAYFPAYARLYPLDPQPALRSRLIDAAARGSSKSYRLIAAELASLDPADIPVNHILPLVQLAAKAQEHRSVINLTRNFGKAHPEHPHLVENYYHAARALAKLGATDKATALLSQLLTRYPEHPKAPHIRYALDQLGGKT